MERVTRRIHRVAVLLCAALALTIPGCLAQQADLTRIKRDLDEQIAKLKEGKQALESSLVRANEVIARQKAEVQDLQTARADLLEDMERLREADLTEVRGTLEQTRHQISGLRTGLEDLNHRLVTLRKNVEGERRSLQTMLKEAQNKLAQHDQALATHGDQGQKFQASLKEFKQALQTLGDELVQEDKRLTTMNGRLEALARDLDDDSQQTDTYLRNVQGNIRSVVETLETVTTKLSTRLDEQAHRLARVEREMPLPRRTDRRSDSGSSQTNVQRSVGGLKESLEPIQIQPDTREGSPTQDIRHVTTSQEAPRRQGPEREPASGAFGPDPSRLTTRQTSGQVDAVATRRADDAESIYDHLLKRVSEGRYETAIHGFSDFLMRFPDSDFAPNAQYWLGECYYGQREFSQAVKEFERVLHMYPESDKVPAALLKIGFAQLELEHWTLAEETLDQLVRAYPETREAQKAQSKLAGFR